MQSSFWSTGTEVIALYNFHGNSPEDLPFRRGDVLTILAKTSDPNWYKAQRADGKTGMMPANYVQKRTEVKLHTMPWYHGKISRVQAEELLSNSEEGLFLVRESNNFPGDYTLCVYSNHKVEHYHIIYKNNRLTIDEEVYFENLLKLVEHYEVDADGLVCRLKQPLTKRGNLEVVVDANSFVTSGWQIKVADIKVVELVGKGESGEVFRAIYKGSEVAAKVLRDKSALQSLLTEASVMTTLRHKNLVQLLGVVLDKTTYIVTEFMAKGSLVEYLRTRGRAVISNADQINFSSDTCEGMAYLEQKGIVHRDLAARNVLIHDDGTAKVADFGLARPVDANQAGGKFPIKWTAPEALKENKFTSKSDMWSFGILLWEIYSFGRVPYPRIPLADVSIHIERGYRMEAPEGCPREVYEVMQKAWLEDPNQRPSFADIRGKLNSLRSATVTQL